MTESLHAPRATGGAALRRPLGDPSTPCDIANGGARKAEPSRITASANFPAVKSLEPIILPVPSHALMDLAGLYSHHVLNSHQRFQPRSLVTLESAQPPVILDFASCASRQDFCFFHQAALPRPTVTACYKDSEFRPSRACRDSFRKPSASSALPSFSRRLASSSNVSCVSGSPAPRIFLRLSSAS